MPQVEGLAEVRDSAEKLARADKVRSTIARRAVNRTVSHARSYATKTIRQKIGLKAAVIRKSIKAYRARGQQNAGRIVVEKNPQPLIRFGARELKRGGVSVAVHRGQRKRIPAAFILEPKQGGRVVAIRRKKPGGGRVGRTPLDFPYGPSPAQLFANGVRALTRRDAQATLEKELRRQTDFELQKIFG